MKRIAIIMILAIISCNSTKVKQTAPKTNKIWELVEFNGFEKEYLIKTKASLNLQNEKTASAQMGCNGMSLPYSINSGSSIKFSNEIIATRMYCEDMKLEREFANTIPKMTSYSITGNKLTLSNDKDEKMIFITQEKD